MNRAIGIFFLAAAAAYVAWYRLGIWQFFIAGWCLCFVAFVLVVIAQIKKRRNTDAR